MTTARHPPEVRSLQVVARPWLPVGQRVTIGLLGFLAITGYRARDSRRGLP